MSRHLRQITVFACLLFFVATGEAVVLACLRTTLDDRAIQWSTRIVEAKLDKISDPPTTTQSSEPHPDNAQIFTFTITNILDGDAKNGQAIRVRQSAAKHSPETHCPTTLRERKIGDRFILLLRPARQSEEWVIVHLLDRDETDASAMDDLKNLIHDVRQTESSATDDAIAAQVTALAVAQDDVEAGEAEKSLLSIGPKVLPAVRAKFDDKSTNDAGKTRLKRVMTELTPPTSSGQAGD